MATLSTPQQSDAGTRQALAPTATTFTPKVVEASKEVLNSSFITQTPPSLHQYAGIVAICTVSGDQAGMDNLGWHIADFLAFRALLCGDNPPKAQTWLAMCDIPALAEANPERYIHGKDRRLVGSAARPEQRQGPRGLIDREDNIQIETSAGSLKERFVTEVKAKLGIAKKHKYPLVLIVCGFTSPDQDIYFGRPDTEHRYTLGALRGELGDDINHVEAMVVTPSLFSAGWHINPSFGGTESPRQVRGGRADFLARQFGGLFAQDLSKSFLGWSCPVLDEAKVDPRTRAKERFPGPVLPSDEVKALASQLQIKIQSCLLGGLSTNHMDHSFSFDKSEDEWETLIGDRGSPPGYRALDWYEQKWAKFVPAQSKSDDGGLAFLGNAFGGTRASQLHHIKYLIEESYLAWPDHWASNFGQETRKDFERFMAMDNPDDLECHEIFNILENRVKQSVLADSIVQYFDLPMPHNHRSRDWHHFRFKQQLSEIDRSSSIKCFSTMLGCVPGPNLPPGVNPNSLSRLQSRLEIGVSYVRAALGIRYLTSKETSKGAVDRIETCMLFSPHDG
ncbi:hypothetical protein F4802DRAFT_34835 [Xylaria palmicola]|nr:hypothetical protein F4802DRAFT_34835 [Xylaria palmicola]